MPDGLCRRLLPKSSLTSSAASSPQGCPGSSTPPTNARATRARPARPASVTLSRTAALTISAPAFSAALVPGNQRDHRADKGMHVRLSGARQARDTRPARPVRGKPTVTSAVLEHGRRPLCVRGPRNVPPYSDTGWHILGQRRNGPPGREFPASGPFPQVVAGARFEPAQAEPTVLQTVAVVLGNVF